MVQTNEKLGMMLTLRIVLPFAAGYYLSYVFRTVNAVIAPDLSAEFSLDPADLGLLTSAYFLTFAAFQLPLGVLLDRVGPRRVEAALLLVAGCGAALFALAEDMAGLLLGRALIGIGVSACLMASFKAFVMWFPPERLPAVNGWIMSAGGLGALSATAPVEALLGLTDWRGLFLGLASACFVVAALIARVVPDHELSRTGEGFYQQIRGIGEVIADPFFRRVAPLTALSQATGLSIQGLWAGPWLHDVAGLERDAVAAYLFAMACAVVAGFLLTGALASRLSRLGVPAMVTAVAGMTLFLLPQLLLIMQPQVLVLPLWMLFGFFGTSGILSYAAFSQHFPRSLAGRVNTTINLFVFVLAFVAQWGIGAIVGSWPQEVSETSLPYGYSVAFAVLLLLQLLALAWFVGASYRFRGNASAVKSAVKKAVNSRHSPR